eukprot:TRINITY_DN5079_c0_g2_i2.p1 TRINITY_DN5079_c0_g2~~TRINITY_DN5079_c0_g2_i2.p1  ORF type:complete len:231 (+),score=31.45 TRINITY_DN5079_c0_g2_i2:64-756(+)
MCIRDRWYQRRVHGEIIFQKMIRSIDFRSLITSRAERLIDEGGDDRRLKTDGSRVRTGTLQTLVDDLHYALSPCVANIKMQGGLVAKIEAFAVLQPEQRRKRRPRPSPIEINVIQERSVASFSDMMMNEDKRSSIIIDNFAHDLIRLIGMAQERGLMLPNVTPNNIFFTNYPHFKFCSFTSETLRSRFESTTGIYFNVMYSYERLTEKKDQSDHQFTLEVASPIKITALY